MVKPYVIGSSQELAGKKITELPNGSYVYRYKSIQWKGRGLVAPQRIDGYLDEWDFVFSSKDEYTEWYKDLILGLAELDECMNYCQYFQRDKGDVGRYVRDGKEYPVRGFWTGYDMNTPELGGFKQFLEGNNWLEDWFELMDRYKK